MIENWGDKAAEELWNTGRSSKIPRVYHQRAKWILEVMHASSSVGDVAAITQPPMLRPHRLKGERKDEMAVDILGKTHPWRIVFKFKGGKFIDVKIENYH
jgi:plasmid maintenance system killer protein